MNKTQDNKDLHTSQAARKRVRKRYQAQTRLKMAGLAAIAFAALSLVTLLYSVVSRALPALTESYISLDINLDKSVIDPQGNNDKDAIYSASYSKLVKRALKKKFPGLGRTEKRKLYKLVSDAAAYELRNHVVKNPSLIGKTISFDLLADDDADLFTKGRLGKVTDISTSGLAHPVGASSYGEEVTVYIQSNALNAGLNQVKQALAKHAGVIERQALNQQNAIRNMQAKLVLVKTEEERAQLLARQKAFQDKYNHLMNQVNDLKARSSQSGGTEELDSTLPSLFISLNGGVIKATQVSPDQIKGNVVVPLTSLKDVNTGDWTLQLVTTPQDNRKITDNQIIWLGQLAKEDRIIKTFNWHFFKSADASEPEEAGILGGLLGTFWTMLVTFSLAFPIGVMGALYLEEFAPKNIFTYLIEVSINNLAAIPSIVFGLLGLAVFVNFFGMPYSSSLVGGIVLALMTLPTVIIASRASIKAVPPSIREAALGIGASKVQTVFQHVLPLAMPGIMTGSILGMAQALGETAPLLMIGMVAFIVDPPTAVTDAAASLPVLVYLWADRAEVAFDMRTAAAILLLLAFLVVMNGLAIMLRKKFERRW